MSEFDRSRIQPDQQLNRRQDVTHDAKSWYNRPHEELVGALGGFIQQRYEAFQVAFTPEEIVRNKLINESAAHSNSPDHQASNFYFTIGLAWDALAYDRYEAGSSAEGIAGSTLNSYAGSPQGSPEIRLTDPLQVKVIDALTEAVGIPHRRGQTVIEIPEKLKGRNYTRWKLSPEYASRLAQAQARRRR